MAAPLNLKKKFLEAVGPLSAENVCFRHIPLAGGASCIAFSSNILNTQGFNRIFATNQVIAANCLWFNAHLGVGLYLYGSKHMRRAPVVKRVIFSIYGSALFNFAAVLMWASAKQLILPDKPGVRTLFGVISGVAMLALGREYLKFVDAHAGDILKGD